jgi:hypothetical protein
MCREKGNHGHQKASGGVSNSGKRGLGRLVRIYRFVFAAIYKWRRKKGAQGSLIINVVGEGRNLKGCHAVEFYLLELA